MIRKLIEALRSFGSFTAVYTGTDVYKRNFANKMKILISMRQVIM
jgi:hypothetical protein